MSDQGSGWAPHISLLLVDVLLFRTALADDWEEENQHFFLRERVFFLCFYLVEEVVEMEDINYLGLTYQNEHFINEVLRLYLIDHSWVICVIVRPQLVNHRFNLLAIVCLWLLLIHILVFGIWGAFGAGHYLFGVSVLIRLLNIYLCSWSLLAVLNSSLWLVIVVVREVVGNGSMLSLKWWLLANTLTLFLFQGILPQRVASLVEGLVERHRQEVVNCGITRTLWSLSSYRIANRSLAHLLLGYLQHVHVSL